MSHRRRGSCLTVVFPGAPSCEWFWYCRNRGYFYFHELKVGICRAKIFFSYSMLTVKQNYNRHVSFRSRPQSNEIKWLGLINHVFFYQDRIIACAFATWGKGGTRKHYGKRTSWRTFLEKQIQSMEALQCSLEDLKYLLLMAWSHARYHHMPPGVQCTSWHSNCGQVTEGFLMCHTPPMSQFVSAFW